jgi:cytochrome c oxidase subunit 5a
MNVRMIARTLRPAARLSRTHAVTPVCVTGVRAMSGSHAHENESFETFSARYEQFFAQVQDLFELQRGLNNCFAYDLVPSESEWFLGIRIHIDLGR